MKRKALLQNLALVGGSLLLFFMLGEVGLRIGGYNPMPDVSEVLKEYRNVEPAVNEPDSKYGWVNKPGHYSTIDYGALGPALQKQAPLLMGMEGNARKQLMMSLLLGHRNQSLTIRPDRSRNTTDQVNEGKPGASALIIGGSYTFGLGLPDHSTYPYILNGIWKDLAVRNFASSGYGTYQSLLRMEEEFSKSNPSVVIYGYIYNHELRNVGSYGHIVAMNLLPRSGQTVSVPFVSVTKAGILRRHQPETYPYLARNRISYLLAFIADRIYRIHAYGRDKEKAEVTDQLLRRMKSLAERKDARFMVVILSVPDQLRNQVQNRLSRIPVETVDCDPDDSVEQANLLPM
ncbi:MAG: SGNH/GDSL hydrolase family protein, partial [Leptospiraceae bacterium]|nr:SGNH/GDSL hydrolase family protein [Leptospiraceae bacterium]